MRSGAVGERKVTVRPALSSDCALIWRWANDPEVRKRSFSSEEITWETHVNWFTRKLQDRLCAIYIAIDEKNLPIGQVRIEKKDRHEAEIHVTVDTAKRGQGYGTSIIKCALEQVEANSLERVNAFVKNDNVASMRAFERARFHPEACLEINGAPSTHWVYRAR